MAKNKCKCSPTTTTTGDDVVWTDTSSSDLKIDKAVYMLLKKIDRLTDKVNEIETNCSCQ